MLDNPVFVQIGLLNCSRDQPCQLRVIKGTNISRL